MSKAITVPTTEKLMTASVLMLQKLPTQSSYIIQMTIENLNQVNGEDLVANTMVVHSGSAFPSWMTQLLRRRQNKLTPAFTTITTGMIIITLRTMVGTLTPKQSGLGSSRGHTRSPSLTGKSQESRPTTTLRGTSTQAGMSLRAETSQEEVKTQALTGTMVPEEVLEAVDMALGIRAKKPIPITQESAIADTGPRPNRLATMTRNLLSALESGSATLRPLNTTATMIMAIAKQMAGVNVEATTQKTLFE